MENKYFYSTEVEWTGERRGNVRAPVLPSIHVDAPPEFKGHRIGQLVLHDNLPGDC